MGMDSVFTAAFEAVRDVSWKGHRERKASNGTSAKIVALQANSSSTSEQVR
jgi:hypothetical protein